MEDFTAKPTLQGLGSTAASPLGLQDSAATAFNSASCIGCKPNGSTPETWNPKVETRIKIPEEQQTLPEKTCPLIPQASGPSISWKGPQKVPTFGCQPLWPGSSSLQFLQLAWGATARKEPPLQHKHRSFLCSISSLHQLLLCPSPLLGQALILPSPQVLGVQRYLARRRWI